MIYKYKSWNNWFKEQANKKDAYKVFSYWQKAKKECKSISLDFKKNSFELKKLIEEQYLDEKFNKSFKLIDKKFKTNFEVSKALIFSKIRNTKLTSKTLYSIMFWLLQKNVVKKKGFEKLIIKRLKNIENFSTKRSKKEVKLFLEKNNIQFKEEKELNTIHLLLKIKDVQTIASPFWCFLYSKGYQDHYIDNEEKEIIVIYEFDKNDNLKNKYGASFVKMKITQENSYFIPTPILNEKNKQELNEKVSDSLLQAIRDHNIFYDDIQTVLKENYASITIKMWIMIHLAFGKKEFIESFNILIKDKDSMEKLMEYFETFSFGTDYGSLDPFVKKIKNTYQYRKWIRAREEEPKRYLNKKITELITAFKIENDSEKAQMNWLKKISEIPIKKSLSSIKMLYDSNNKILDNFKYKISYLSIMNPEQRSLIVANGMKLSEYQKEHAIENLTSNKDLNLLKNFISEKELFKSKLLNVNFLEKKDLLLFVKYQKWIGSRALERMELKFSKEEFEKILEELIINKKISIRDFLDLKSKFHLKYIDLFMKGSKLKSYNLEYICKNPKRFNVNKYLEYIDFNCEDSIELFLEHSDLDLDEKLEILHNRSDNVDYIINFFAYICFFDFKIYKEKCFMLDGEKRIIYKKMIRAWLMTNGLKSIKKEEIIEEFQDEAHIAAEYIYLNNKSLDINILNEVFDFLGKEKGKKINWARNLLKFIIRKYPNQKDSVKAFYEQRYSFLQRLFKRL